MKGVLFALVLGLLATQVGCSGDDLGVDMTRTVTDTNASPVNLSSEVANAKRENKLLLLEFASSDSCPPCVLLQQTVFSSPEFKAFAKTNLDFVRLDFPLKVNLHPDTVATNEILMQQFDVDGFPTFVALGKNGKEIWRMEGVESESLFEPTNFINMLKDVKKKES